MSSYLLSILLNITIDKGTEPEEEQDPFKKFNMVRRTLSELKKEQIKEFQRAKDFIDSGDIKRGIFLLEKIVYEDGLHVADNKLVLYLGEVYLEQNLLQQCKNFIGFMNKKYPAYKSEVDKLLAKLEAKT